MINLRYMDDKTHVERVIAMSESPIAQDMTAGASFFARKDSARPPG